MAAGRKWLSVAGLYAVLFGSWYGLQSPYVLPQPPPTTLPASTPSASVRADDEPARSLPFQDIARTSPPPSRSPQPDILTSFRPATPAARPAAKPEGSGKTAARYVTINNQTYPVRTYRPLALPDDPAANQWWVSNTKLDQSWDIPNGSHDTLLAIIDGGFALQHEEFAGRWYVNPGEIAGNGLDDDGDGFVDDVSGWDFINDDNSPQAGEVDPAGSGTRHGSVVAGVAAATGNNGKGIAGVDWHTRILPLQALDDDGYGDTVSVGKAILYAAARGADVISISLGSDLPDDFVRYAIRQAEAAGSLVVAAAGNDGCDCMVYPGNYPEVVGVGALDTDGQPASFSSYGANLDILAPGTGITAPTWTAANPTNAYTSGAAGTSFATPMVSGLLTRLKSLQPEATPLQLLAALTENTDRLSLPASASRSPQLGTGGLDALAAIQRMTTSRTPGQLYAYSPVSKGALLAPKTPTEKQAAYQVQACTGGRPGTTPVFELTRAGAVYFTISQVEVWLARAAGYQAWQFGEACLEQPQDAPGSIRSLSLPHEFLNSYDKP